MLDNTFTTNQGFIRLEGVQVQAVSIREIQHHLAEYLRIVELGEELTILRRRTPVAKIMPLTGKTDTSRMEKRLKALEELKGISASRARAKNIGSWIRTERDSWKR